MSDFFEKMSRKVRESILMKLMVIGIMTIMLLVPTSMVESLISERQWTKQQAIDEISSNWGEAQTVTGPILSIPYSVISKNSRTGEVSKIKHLVHLLPTKLQIDGKSITKSRYRGIYNAVVYTAGLAMTGHFDFSELANLTDVPLDDLEYDKAVLSLGINDLKGLQERVTGKIGTKDYELKSGVASKHLFRSGINTKLNLTKAIKSLPFSFDMELNGSKQLMFLPLGKDTNVKMISNWANPSFGGSFLPRQRDITEKGFTANWKVQDLNREYPQIWTDNDYRIDCEKFGVTFIEPINVYQQSTRTIKYAVMFIIFTFAALFLCEVLCKFSVHPIQYLFIGCAIVMFYALLISLSEHINFDVSYFIASIGVLAMVSGYVKALFGKLKFVLTIFSVLTVLYGYLYLLLQMSDYALVSGTIGLFALLGVLMYLTRNINWYSLKMETKPAVTS